MSIFPGKAIFSPSKPKLPPPPPPTPKREDPAVLAAAQSKAKKLRATKRGLSATILTGAQGASGLGTSAATEAGRSKLLG